MQCSELIVDALERVAQDLRRALEGLTAEQLAFRPSEQANSIAWLAWHLARVQDDHVSEIAGRRQVSVEHRWFERFGRGADDTGFGDSPDQVASIRPTDATVLVEYFMAVHNMSLDYLKTATCDDLDRIIDPSFDPPVTVGVRLISVVNDCTQHVGQMAYVRGLMENKHWLPW